MVLELIIWLSQHWGEAIAYGILPFVLVSYLNVVIWRKSWRASFSGYSQCEYCHHRLGAVELIPIAGYLIHGGKCKHCGEPINPLHPLLETAFAVGWFGLVIRFGLNDPWLPAIMLTYAYGYFLAAYDLKYRYIPRNETILGLLLMTGIQVWRLGTAVLWPVGAMAALVVSSVLVSSWISKKSIGSLIGHGDWLVVLMIAVLVGLPASWWVILVACLLGLATTMAPIVGKRVPFVTMLFVATWIVILF